MQGVAALRQIASSIQIMSLDRLAGLLEGANHTQAPLDTSDVSEAHLANGEHVLIVQGAGGSIVVVSLIN